MTPREIERKVLDAVKSYDGVAYAASQSGRDGMDARGLIRAVYKDLYGHIPLIQSRPSGRAYCYSEDSRAVGAALDYYFDRASHSAPPAVGDVLAFKIPLHELFGRASDIIADEIHIGIAGGATSPMPAMWHAYGGAPVACIRLTHWWMERLVGAWRWRAPTPEDSHDVAGAGEPFHVAPPPPIINKGLTSREKEVLTALAAAPEDDLVKLHEVRAATGAPSDNTCAVNICNIRKKMGADYIETVWIRGHRLSPRARAELSQS